MSRPNFPPPPPPAPSASTTGASLYMAVGVGVSSILGVGVVCLGVVLALGGGTSRVSMQNETSTSIVQDDSSDHIQSPSTTHNVAVTSQPEQAEPEGAGDSATTAEEETSTTESETSVEMQSEPSSTTSASSENAAPAENNSAMEPPASDSQTPQSEPINTPPPMSSNGRPLDAVRALQNVLQAPPKSSEKTPIKLVALNVQEEELNNLELDLSSSFSEDQIISTKKVTNSNPPTWEVSVQGAGSLGQARHDATFAATPEGLMFNWERSSPHPNILFSPLKLTYAGAGGNRDEEVCKLFTEIPLDPLKITFDTPTKKLSINTSEHSLPEIDSLLLRVEFKGLGEDAKLKSASRVPTGTPVEIILPDPEFTDEPLLAFDVTFQAKNKNIEIEIAQFLNHQWVNKSTNEPELVKHPLELTMFTKLEKEAELLTKTLSRKVEREIEPKLAQLENLPRSRTNNNPNVAAQINALLDQRDKYESAILAMEDLSLMEDIVVQECKRLEQEGTLQFYFEIIPDHTKPDETIVVIKSK